MAIPTTLPILLSDVVTEMGLALPQSILTVKANVNACGINPTYFTNNGNDLTDYRGYNHTGGPTGSISPSSAILAQGGGTQAVTITCTSGFSWSITDNQTWASLSPVTGTGNGSSTLTYSANNNASSRNIRLTLTRSCDGATMATVIWTQSGTA